MDIIFSKTKLSEKLFQYFHANNGSLIVLQKSNLELLLIKAKKLEKKYEWLQAAKFYKKTSDLATQKRDTLKVAELQEHIGFCYFKAALQAKTNFKFRKCIKQAIQAYERESKILEGVKEEDKLVKINHANALVAYARSWFETRPSVVKELLAKWWNLENQVLAAYESVDDLYSVGKTCNDLIELSIYDRFFLVSSGSERKRIFKECLILAEKAIHTLSKVGNDFELARAYCFASWYHSFSNFFTEFEDEVIQLNQKCQDYLNKALELSQKIGDAWLISWYYNTAWMAAQNLTFNPASAIKYGEKTIKFGRIAKDNYLIGVGNILTSFSITYLAGSLEDPEKQKESFEKAKKMGQEAIHNFEIIHNIVGFHLSYPYHSQTLTSLASIETNSKTKQALLEKAIKVNQEGIDRVRDWKVLIGYLSGSLSVNLRLLSETKSEIEEKRDLLYRAQSFAKKFITYLEDITPFFYQRQSLGYYQLALVQTGLATIETNNNEKIKLLNQASVSIEKSLKLIKKKQKLLQTAWASGFYFGKYYDKLGRILQRIHSMTKEKKSLKKAIEAYKKASFYFRKAEIPTHMAESYWHMGQLYDQLGEYQEASQNYELAYEGYSFAAKKIPQLKEFYRNFSIYMLAWSQIEQARHTHSIEEYDKAKEYYEKAAKLHESSEPWSYLANNYFAWASVEEAESLSRKEDTQQAKQVFQKALEQFSKAEDSIKQRIGEITSEDEKEMTQRLFKASDLRRKFCQARILLEKAKLLDRKGEYLQSSKSYGEAAEKIETIVEQLEAEAERKELKLLATLCQAWEKMAIAEETTSSESYLEAARLFEQAKEHCYTKKASLWTLGNSNFCKGLAAGTRYQGSMDLKENALAKRYIKSAASCYLQAGFKSASEYAKATQRLFDAYVFMNQAESEVSPENKAKQYQMAENLLQISAGSFMKAKQPEKTAQVQQIMKQVREEKALAVSLNEVMHAPKITSSTTSFKAPTTTNEVSVGLESFEHANVQANLIAGAKEVKVGESFCLTVEFVNAGKEPALLTRVEDFVPTDFVVVEKPEIYRLEDNCLNMKGKQLAPLKLVEAKLVLQPSKRGVYQVKPIVHYLDELGQNKSLQLKYLEIKVEEVILEDRVSTGTKELDSLLLGGIPNGYAVALTGPPSDERQTIINNFSQAGAKEEQITFFITTEAVGLENLLDESSFYLFLCNPKPKAKVPDLPNVYKLRSKTDLTNLNIALAKAYRTIDQSGKASRRACVEILSDVLLRHGAEVTRRWISELITNMGSKGFTLLAVMNPGMHPKDQATAVLDLFDGEISLFETETATECKRSIRVKRLRNQDYIKNPICLTKPT